MYIHGSHDFTAIIHLCILSMALILGSVLRSKIKFLQKYLIPAPMIGGLFLFFFYNYIASSLKLGAGQVFLEELMFHLLNISFIAMQLRIPVNEKHERKTALWHNITAISSQYGLQATLGLLVVVLFFRNSLPGAAKALGLTLCLGFELGPGQAESMSKVWEGAPYFVEHAGSVGLIMAAIGFCVGSIIGVVLINTAAKQGWVSQEYIEKLRHRKTGNGFFKDRRQQLIGSRQTTANESMDTFTLHFALILFTYLLSYLFLCAIEGLVAKYVGGKVLEAVEGMWGINFVFSSLFAILVRKVIIACDCAHIIDNGTCNRIDGLAVDLTVVSCLGAIRIAAFKAYWPLIIALSLTGILITCFFVPWFCSRLFNDYQFFRMLMIFGCATGTLPTALSLVRVVDPDFDTPVAQDFINSMGVMFVLALPILAFVNMPAKGHPVLFMIICSVYIVFSFVMYFCIAKKKAFAKPEVLFYTDGN